MVRKSSLLKNTTQIAGKPLKTLNSLNMNYYRVYFTEEGVESDSYVLASCTQMAAVVFKQTHPDATIDDIEFEQEN